MDREDLELEIKKLKLDVMKHETNIYEFGIKIDKLKAEERRVGRSIELQEKEIAKKREKIEEYQNQIQGLDKGEDNQ